MDPMAPTTNFDITDLVAAIEATIERGDDDAAQMQAAADGVRRLLGNASFLETHYGVTRADVGDYLLYRHPEHEFVIRSRVLQPGKHTPPHDHGSLWAVYGAYDGAVKM